MVIVRGGDTRPYFYMTNDVDIEYRRSKFRFEKTVSLGNILTAGAFILGISVSWSKMDSRLTAVETIVQADHAVIQELVKSNVELATLARIYDQRVEKLESQQIFQENLKAQQRDK